MPAISGAAIAVVALIAAATAATATTAIKASNDSFENAGDAAGDWFANLLMTYPTAVGAGVVGAAAGAGTSTAQTAAGVGLSGAGSGAAVAGGAASGTATGAGTVAAMSADEMAMMAEPALQGVEVGVNTMPSTATGGNIVGRTGAISQSWGDIAGGVFDPDESTMANILNKLGADPEYSSLIDNSDFQATQEGVDTFDTQKQSNERKRQQRARQAKFADMRAWDVGGQGDPWRNNQVWEHVDIWEQEQEELKRLQEQDSLGGSFSGLGGFSLGDY
ncbi:MAG: hypothetical protein HN929_01590 [Chloroflexi bacterium]|jgi:hypothetical protein|nr:hypothetical protein [Chloroflexota bacterium]